MSTLTGFDLFDLPDEPEVVTPARALASKLGEEPTYLSAEHLFKPDALSLLADLRVLWFRRSGEWAVHTRVDSPAMAKKIFAGLIARRKLPASQPAFHDKRLHLLVDSAPGRASGATKRRRPSRG